MAVVENMDGEDGPALVPGPPDLLPLDASKEVFEDTDLSLDASKEVFEDTDLEARRQISNEWFEDTELEAGGQVSNEWFEDTELEAGGQVSNMMNLLRIAIYNISYIRGLFPEQYFRDISVPELEMTIKKLIPKDVESRRLLDWIDEGVSDAMQKKYLETVHFCICEKDEGAPIEDYSFIFNYPNASCEEVAMEFSLDGSEGTSHMFKSNPAESTGNQIRRLIRISAAMMSTLDQLPNERTVLIKLMYHDDVTPEDYEPPLFECCHDDADYTDLIQSFGRLCCISQRAPTLLLDSAATHHIFCDKSYMTKMKKISKDKRIELSAADGAKFKAKKTGSIDIGNIHLSQVR